LQVEFNEIDKKNDMMAIIMRGYEMEIARQKQKLTDQGIEYKEYVDSP
jgi:hypothetical protein